MKIQHYRGESTRHLLVGTLAAAALLHAAWAEDFNQPPTAEELAKLGLEGTEWTPSGAIRAGNAEGTIPPWKNEPLAVPAGFEPGSFHPDPFPEDQPLFTITAQNYREHADKLTPGQEKMFEIYPDYFMNIYPTRRTAVFQPHCYEATLENARRSRIVPSDRFPGLLGFDNARLCWAFPVAKSGPQALSNLYTRPQVPWRDGFDNIAPITASGDYEIITLSVQVHRPYSDPANGWNNPDFDVAVPGSAAMYYQTTTAPAKQAGQVVLARDPISFSKQFRQAWSYSPGQRRVKRAPQIVHDNPATSSDGLMTTDQGWGFNGPNDRFHWTLEGREEVYVPYNAYRLHSGDLKASDIVTPQGRLNQNLARYELHRVWKLKGTLKEGTTHDYGVRVLYLDEDSWWAMLGDHYDRRGELWRLYELHTLMYYDQKAMDLTTENQYDMQAGRMVIRSLDNQEKGINFSFRAEPSYFTPAEVRRRGLR